MTAQRETVMSLLSESCAVRAEQAGDTARAQQYRAEAQAYRRPARPVKTRQGPAQPRHRTTRATPGRYMTEAQRGYLADLIAPRPEPEAEAIIAALNAEWQARTLTVGRASAWISHLLSHPCILAQPEQPAPAPAESHPHQGIDSPGF